MYKLNVPTEAQAKNSTCWHASALMIWRYSQSISKREGPMDTLSQKWTKNNPIYPSEFVQLAERAGLVSLHKVGNSYSSVALETLLRSWGPLWCAGFWYGFGHVIVLTGVDAKKVYLNDPDGGRKRSGSIAWFNQKLAGDLIGSLMAKNPAAY